MSVIRGRLRTRRRVEATSAFRRERVIRWDLATGTAGSGLGRASGRRRGVQQILRELLHGLGDLIHAGCAWWWRPDRRWLRELLQEACHATRQTFAAGAAARTLTTTPLVFASRVRLKSQEHQNQEHQRADACRRNQMFRIGVVFGLELLCLPKIRKYEKR